MLFFEASLLLNEKIGGDGGRSNVLVSMQSVIEVYSAMGGLATGCK